MSIEKRLEEILKRANTAVIVVNKEVLDVPAEEHMKSYISLGGELDSIILCAKDALEEIDTLKGKYNETT